MKRVLLSGALATLCACGTPVPIIDMEGKDPTQTNRDLAYCQATTADTLSWGNPIAKCMQAKGYRPIGVY